MLILYINFRQNNSCGHAMVFDATTGLRFKEKDPYESDNGFPFMLATVKYSLNHHLSLLVYYD